MAAFMATRVTIRVNLRKKYNVFEDIKKEKGRPIERATTRVKLWNKKKQIAIQTYFLRNVCTKVATAHRTSVKLHKSEKVMYLKQKYPFVVSQITLLKTLLLGISFPAIL